jgi:hypothetical protein
MLDVLFRQDGHKQSHTYMVYLVAMLCLSFNDTHALQYK